MTTKANNTQTNRPRYSRAFKLEAVELVQSGDRPVAEIARSLGVKRELLYTWRDAVRKHGAEYAFRGRGQAGPKSDQAEQIAALRRELAHVKEERDILKKAAAYFAKELS